MTEPYTIVPAKLNDLNALRELEKTCFPLDAWSIFDLVAVLTFPKVIRLKAIQAGEMVGFIAGDPRPSEGFAWIATVGVLPEYRQQGIGRALLRECEDQLSTPSVRLSVRKTNDTAIRLYRNEGYQTIDIWKNYYNDGADAVIMEKRRIITGF